MLFRVDALRRIPPIPEDLKFLNGDTWIFHHAWRMRQKVGIMLHNRIHHFYNLTRKESVEPVGEGVEKIHPVVRADMETRRTKYAWLSSKRPGLHRWIPGRRLRVLFLPYYRRSNRWPLPSGSGREDRDDRS